jgi:hypothetical protein
MKAVILKQQETLETIQANLPKLPEAAKQGAKSTQIPRPQPSKPAMNENAPPGNKATGGDALSLINSEELESIPKYVCCSPCLYLALLISSQTVLFPSFFFLSVLCRYLKGRMTLEKINESINSLNEIYLEKYKLMATNPSKLKEPLKTRYFDSKALETKDTQGFLPLSSIFFLSFFLFLFPPKNTKKHSILLRRV